MMPYSCVRSSIQWSTAFERPSGRQQATHLATTACRLDSDEPLRPTPQIVESVRSVSNHRRVDQGPFAVAKNKSDVRSGQRRPRQAFLGMPELGFGRSQELSSCRHVEKQIADFNRRTAGASIGLGTENAPAFNRYSVSTRGRVVGGNEQKPRYRGNRRQRFAAEAEGTDVVEVRGVADLGRGVALESEQRIVRVHSAAVIRHPDQAAPPGGKLDFDPLRAGVEAVLHQLFDD